MEREYKRYVVAEHLNSRPNGAVTYDNFKSAKDLAERLVKKTGKAYYIFERMEVVNCVGVVDGERKER